MAPLHQAVPPRPGILKDPQTRVRHTSTHLPVRRRDKHLVKHRTSNHTLATMRRLQVRRLPASTRTSLIPSSRLRMLPTASKLPQTPLIVNSHLNMLHTGSNLLRTPLMANSHPNRLHTGSNLLRTPLMANSHLSRLHTGSNLLRTPLMANSHLNKLHTGNKSPLRASTVHRLHMASLQLVMGRRCRKVTRYAVPAIATQSFLLDELALT